jgi:sigma-B regulation protein RsbU (phosphoserine phosphatase)
MGLKNKIVSITVLAMTILTAAIMIVGYFLYHNGVYDSYRKYAATANDLTMVIFDKYHMGDLIASRSMDDTYEVAREEMNSLKDCADVKYLYAIYFEDIEDIHSVCYVINGKNKEEREIGIPIEEIYSYMGEKCEEDAFDDGTLLLYQDAIKNDLTDMMYRESTTSEYGHLITCYQVVHDSNGTPVGILGVDVDMNQINRDLTHYLAIIVLLAALIAVAVIFVFTRFLNDKVIHPITNLSHNTDSFVALMEKDVEPEELVYDPVEVQSHDEIFELSNNVTSMAEGIQDYLRNLRTVTAEKERIGVELNLATQIQAGVLPEIMPFFSGHSEYDICATMIPAKEVGGDFYDFFYVDDNHLAMVIADVSGKGIPAALFMMISKLLIKNRTLFGGSPAQILAQSNDLICEGNSNDMFVTVWLGIVDLSTGVVTAANAGHEYPVVQRPDGVYEIYKDRHGLALGAMEGVRYRDYSFTLEKGSRLFVYTDGVAEANDKVHNMFGMDRIVTVLNENQDSTPDDTIKNMLIAVEDFCDGAEQFDDTTMLSFLYK